LINRIEIFISFFFKDNQLFEDTPNILFSSNWTGLWITWGGGFISLGIHGVSKSLIMDEYKTKNSISSLYPDSFLYYGIMGTGVLWSTEFCQKCIEYFYKFCKYNVYKSLPIQYNTLY